jgi:hypothetical protein
MAPHYERRAMLEVALDQAVHALGAPIEQITVGDRTIEVIAGPFRLRGTFRYDNAYSPEGSPMPGSGRWSVTFGPPEPVAEGLEELFRG